MMNKGSLQKRRHIEISFLVLSFKSFVLSLILQYRPFVRRPLKLL